jgi:hypothetical protein
VEVPIHLRWIVLREFECGVCRDMHQALGIVYAYFQRACPCGLNATVEILSFRLKASHRVERIPVEQQDEVKVRASLSSYLSDPAPANACLMRGAIQTLGTLTCNFNLCGQGSDKPGDHGVA